MAKQALCRRVSAGSPRCCVLGRAHIHEYGRSLRPCLATTSGVPATRPVTPSPSQEIPIARRGWDSNPRGACTPNGFQDRPVRPLRHPAGAHCDRRLPGTDFARRAVPSENLGHGALEVLEDREDPGSDRGRRCHVHHPARAVANIERVAGTVGLSIDPSFSSRRPWSAATAPDGWRDSLDSAVVSTHTTTRERPSATPNESCSSSPVSRRPTAIRGLRSMCELG